MFKRFFKKASYSITSAAFIVASFSLISRFFGFIRDRILAGEFGASDSLDIYFAAFRAPDLLFQLVVVGGISASFIPIFNRLVVKKKGAEWAFVNRALHLILCLFGVLAIVAAVFAFELAGLVAPGFDAAKQMQVAELMRVMFVAQFLLAASMVFGSVLQGMKRFMVYSVAPILYNMGIIFGILVFYPRFGLVGLAWGVVFGAGLHLLMQAFGAWNLGYRWRPSVKLDKDVKLMMKQSVPRVLGLVVNQVNFLAMTIIASLLVAGSVTVVQFAYNLNFFAIGIIAVSYAVAAFPAFCEYVNKKEMGKLRSGISSTVRQTLFFIVPATALFLILRAQIVRIVFGAGEFDWISTVLTANTLGIFALSFFAQALVYIFVRAFFAMHDTWTPFVVGLIAAGVNVGVAMMLVGEYGVLGLAMGFSVAAVVQMGLLWILLRRKAGELDGWRIAWSFLIMLGAGGACAVVAQYVKTAYGTYVDLDTFVAVLGQFGVAAALGGVTYLVVAGLLRSEELGVFMAGVRKKLLRKVKPEEAVVDLA